MSRARNVAVAQSGGPTPVINNSLRGVWETCRAIPGVFGVCCFQCGDPLVHFGQFVYELLFFT
jgi:6-phosphofructokinase